LDPPPTAVDTNIVTSAVIVQHRDAYPRRILIDMLGNRWRYIGSHGLLDEYLTVLLGRESSVPLK